jgi:hypothetical protein
VLEDLPCIVRLLHLGRRFVDYSHLDPKGVLVEFGERFAGNKPVLRSDASQNKRRSLQRLLQYRIL